MNSGKRELRAALSFSASPNSLLQLSVKSSNDIRHHAETKRARHGNRLSMVATPPQMPKRKCSRRIVLGVIAAQFVFPLQPKSFAQEMMVSENKTTAIEQLRQVTALQDLAFQYTNQLRFTDAEILWTKIISLNENNAAAFSNRGNCRTSQGRFRDAIQDFNRAIELAPDEPDPFLGKGIALEGLRDFAQALNAYETANKLSKLKYEKEDPVALNNIGNAYGALGKWEKAYDYYKQAALMDRNFVFALANQALSMYQLGDDEKALQIMRFLSRKYPGFADMHAAIAMVLWERREQATAEDEWYKAVQSDRRYEDAQWVIEVRRWPPRLVEILRTFQSPVATLRTDEG